MKRLPILFAILISALVTARGQQPLDAALTDFRYPYPVKLREFRDQQQDLAMAYMDVKPDSPNGRTVVLMHGKNFSGAYWETTARELLKQGYRVVIPDQLGFGKSSKPLGYQYSFQAYAVQTRELLKELEIERAAVVGHSMGGMVATRFSLMFPAAVERLVLVNPIGLEDWKRLTPYQTIDQATEAEKKKTPDDIRAYMKASYFDGQWRPEYEPLVALQAGWALGPDRERMAAISARTSDMVFTQPVVYEFPDLKVPTLLIIGDRDRTAIGKNLAPPAVAAQMGQYQLLGPQTAAAIPGAKLVMIAGAGHLPQVEKFDEYLAALSGFLGEGH